MDYKLFRIRIEKIVERIEELGGEVQEVLIDEPATLNEIQAIEEQLSVELPASFKKVLLEFSKNFSLRWFLPDEIHRPDEFREIFSGRPHWSLKLLPQFEENRKGWIENVFPNPEDPYDVVWHNKLAFCEVGDGDLLAFDMNYKGDAPIVYLCHDGSKEHGYKLANNFIELLEHWSRIAFVGPEYSQWLPFTTGKESGIISDGDTAKRFRNWLGLDI